MTIPVRIRRGRDAGLAGIALAAIAGFAWLSARVKNRTMERFDRKALRSIKRLRREPLDSLVRDVTSLGGVPLVGLAYLGSAVAMRNSPIALTQLALGAVGGGIADVALKRHFARPRPEVIPPLAYVNSWSYPSGHSIASSSLYLTLAFTSTRHAPTNLRVAAIAAAGALSVCVGASRVYLGVHHPTDVLAGLAIGTAWACLLEAAFESRKAWKLERELTPEAVRPSDIDATVNDSRSSRADDAPVLEYVTD